MSDLKTILDGIQASDSVKADAWDAFQSAATPDDFQARFDKLPLLAKDKAALWDAKFADVSVKLDFNHDAPGGDPNPPASLVGVGGDIAQRLENDHPFLQSAVEFAKNAGSMVNPYPLLKSLYENTTPAELSDQLTKSVADFRAGNYSDAASHAIGAVPVLGAGFRIGQGIGDAHVEQFKKAKSAFDEAKTAFKEGRYLDAESRYSEAVGHTLAGVTPLVGPAAAGAGEALAAGDTAKGLGQASGLVLPAPALRGLAKARQVPWIDAHLPRLRVPSTLNPIEQKAVDFGDAEGIPIDAATRTGSGFIRGIQNLLQRQPGSSGVAGRMRTAQADALASTGERLRQAVDPTLGAQSYTPEAAGHAVRDSIAGRVSKLKEFVDEAYSRFRAAANDPANVREVEVGSQSATMASHVQSMARNAAIEEANAWADATASTRDFQRNLKEGVPYTNADEWRALNAAGKEIDEAAVSSARKPGTSGTKEGTPLAGFKESPKDLVDAIRKGQSATGHGSPLYDKILEAFTDALIGERGDEIRAALKAAGVEDTGAGLARVAITKKMALPVDMRGVKAALRPLYEQMKMWLEPARRNASAGFQAVASIVNGPDHLPAVVAEQGLGGLKSLAREASSPDMRDVNAGIGAHASTKLQAAIDETVSSAGPDAIDALKAGRMAHSAKMAAAEVLDSLRDEPVQAFDQATWAKDAGIVKLRQIAKLAPAEMAKIGRAYIAQLLEMATRDGGFGKAATLQSKWAALGPETKQILFKNPMLIDKLDNFFRLAKNIAENPNPSGTASTAATLTTGGLMFTHPLLGTSYLIGTRAVGELLFTPRGAKALVSGLKVPIANKAAAALAADTLLTIAGKDAEKLSAAQQRSLAPPQ